MRCRVCRAPAVIEVRRHNAGFCQTCFCRHCREQVRRAIDDYDMIDPGDRVLVAVSGGKDSLALWDILLDLGYQADGLYVGLGIGEYSDASVAYARDFAVRRDVTLIEIDVPGEYGFDISGGRPGRTAGAVLGVRPLQAPPVQPGCHRGRLPGDRHRAQPRRRGRRPVRQRPALGHRLPGPPAPRAAGQPRLRPKVKPLVRLSERETAAYCLLSGIDYIVEECPMAEGNKHLGYKEALNQIEVQSPGSKAAFYFTFVDRVSSRFTAEAEVEREGLHPCPGCASPTTGELCAFCKLVIKATGGSVR